MDLYRMVAMTAWLIRHGVVFFARLMKPRNGAPVSWQ